MKLKYWILLIFLLIYGHSMKSFAQSNEATVLQDTEEDSDVNFEARTADDNLGDVDSDEPSLFDDPNEDPNDDSLDDNENESLYEGNYTLEFTSENLVTFSNLLTGEAYISIKYITQIKQDLDLSKKRSESIGYANIETEVTGQYASSQFFTCTLDVQVDRALIEIKSRTNVTPETDEEESKTNVALQISFDKSYSENWYSNCKGSDDSSMNTIAQDSPENYNLQILDLMTPTLKGLSIDEFEMGQALSFDTTMDSFDSEDFDTGESVTYEGQGTFTLTPQ